MKGLRVDCDGEGDEMSKSNNHRTHKANQKSF